LTITLFIITVLIIYQEDYMKKIKCFGLPLFTLLALMIFLLSSCSEAGMGDVGDDIDVAELEFLALPSAALYGVIGSPDSGDSTASDSAVLLASTASAGVTLAQVYITLVSEGWDSSQPSSYSSNGLTFTWETSGNTFTWTYTYDFGGESASIVIEVTDNGSDRDVLVTIDGNTMITGTVADDGDSGNARYYPLPEDPSESYDTVWGPAVSPYELKYTTTEYSGGTATALLTINTTLDGESGSWSYEEPIGTVVADNSWAP
jgi:hypothetical protein